MDRVRTTPIRSRRNKVRKRDFGQLVPPSAAMDRFVRALPSLLAGRDFRDLVELLARTARAGRLVGIAVGGHVVKTGVAPHWIDLLRRGVVGAVAMNGATAIHDFEIALIGETSEDVAAGIRDGTFGMSRETHEAFAAAAARARADRIGLGMALGRGILERRLPHRESSLLAEAARRDVPATVHVSIGADIVHMSRAIDPGALGEATARDFERLVGVVAGLEGGVWMNVGSAVVLPETFLKAVNVARNAGARLDDVTCVDLDMLRHYRALTNVVDRPGTRGISITGHHEILVPLLRAAVLSRLAAMRRARGTRGSKGAGAPRRRGSRGQAPGRGKSARPGRKGR